MTRLDNEEFFKSLSNLLTKANGESSVYFTQKRLIPAKSNVQVESEKIEPLLETPVDEDEYPVLIRVTDGKKIKYSTLVQADRLDTFWTQYTNLLKSGVIGLKKKDKKKSKKKKTAKN